MKKIIIYLLLVAAVFSCKRLSYRFLEEQAFDEKTPFSYYATSLTQMEKIFNIDSAFQLTRIGAQERPKFEIYVKIYFDPNQVPLRVENYRRDNFNTHIYYPYLIFNVEKKGEDFVVSEISKKWNENQELVTSNVKVKIFKNKQEGEFAKLVEIVRQNLSDISMINQQFSFSFVANQSQSNKATQEAVSSEEVVILDGYHKDYPDIHINLFFFSEKRSEAAGFVLGEETPIIARLSKISAKSLDFIFLSFNLKKMEENKNPTQNPNNAINSSSKSE